MEHATCRGSWEQILRSFSFAAFIPSGNEILPASRAQDFQQSLGGVSFRLFPAVAFARRVLPQYPRGLRAEMARQCTAVNGTALKVAWASEFCYLFLRKQPQMSIPHEAFKMFDCKINHYSTKNDITNKFAKAPRPNHRHQHISINKPIGGYQQRLPIYRAETRAPPQCRKFR